MGRRARVRTGALVGRRRFEMALADDPALHLQSHADSLERQGVPRAEARRRARLEVGGPEENRGRGG